MTHPDPLGPAERAAQLAAIDDQLARQRHDLGLMPLPTGDRFADLDALDGAVGTIEAAWDQADREWRGSRSADLLPADEDRRETARLASRRDQLWAMRSRAIARRDSLLTEPDGPFC